MPIKRSNFIDNILSEKQVDIPEEYKEELSQELLRININREKMIACVLIIIGMIMICFDILAMSSYKTAHPRFLRHVLSHAILFLGPIVFFILEFLIGKGIIKNSGLVKFTHVYISMLVLIICSVITINSGFVRLPPFAYIMANVSIASLVLFNPLERHIMYLCPLIIDITETMLSGGDYNIKFQEIFFFALITILSMMVSCINYDLFVSNFVSNKTVIKKNGEIDKLYKTTRDLLNQRTKELNEAKEYEKVRTAFFANISHELRTPLNIIFSAEQMLNILIKEGDIAANRNQIDGYMAMIKQNCYRLIRLINNLIDITKIDAGYFPVNLINCDIVRVVEDIVGSVAKYIEDRNIGITFDTEIEEQIIACDPDGVERIMLNLLSNSIKFTPEGGDINVNIYQIEDRISISVKDTGIGIPEEMRELIFERFVQVDKTTTRNREGSGIGLSIVKSLVELQEGDISLSTSPGEGSEFVISLPVKLVDNEEFVSGINMIGYNETIENINIEFSDIY